MIKELLVNRYLDRLRNKTGNNENIYLVRNLADVLSLPPFTDQKKIHTFCDLDGVVLLSSLKEGANFSSLLALGRIARRSSGLTLWSLRPQVSDNFLPAIFDHRSISLLPVISRGSALRLETFFARVAPKTRVDFSFGLSKLTKDGMLPKVNNVLNSSDKEVALIGSSVFDRFEVNRLLEKLPNSKKSRLWYFDTGRIVF